MVPPEMSTIPTYMNLTGPRRSRYLPITKLDRPGNGEEQPARRTDDRRRPAVLVTQRPRNTCRP